MVNFSNNHYNWNPGNLKRLLKSNDLIRQVALGIYVLVGEVQTKSSSKLNDSLSMSCISGTCNFIMVDSTLLVLKKLDDYVY